MPSDSMQNKKIILNAQITDNDWLILEELENNQLPEGKLLVSLDIWNTHKETLKQRKNIGLYLKNDQCVSTLSDDLDLFAVIAIDFPVFMDGRGFSIARILRDRYNYQGELRATGGIIRDQLCYLKRCGFNAFDMSPEINLEAALASLEDFSESYQAAADQINPLFRRRA